MQSTDRGDEGFLYTCPTAHLRQELQLASAIPCPCSSLKVTKKPRHIRRVWKWQLICEMYLKRNKTPKTISATPSCSISRFQFHVSIGRRALELLIGQGEL
jgi:hypothetical protein